MKTMKCTHPALEEYEELMFPYHWEICCECNGEGYRERRDIDCSRLVESMLEDGDEEGVDDYRKGAYDEFCKTCVGTGKVRVFDLPEWASKLVADWERSEAADRAYARAEARAMGYDY